MQLAKGEEWRMEVERAKVGVGEGRRIAERPRRKISDKYCVLEADRRGSFGRVQRTAEVYRPDRCTKFISKRGKSKKAMKLAF